MLKYYKQFLEACEETDIKILSDDYCCQLLALVSVFGNEDMIFQGIMLEDIKTAQKRLNIIPGAIPNGELVAKMSDYIDELQEAVHEAHEEILGNSSETEIEWGLISQYIPEWAQAIEKRYKTRFRR